MSKKTFKVALVLSTIHTIITLLIFLYGRYEISVNGPDVGAVGSIILGGLWLLPASLFVSNLINTSSELLLLVSAQVLQIIIIFIVTALVGWLHGKIKRKKYNA